MQKILVGLSGGVDSAVCAYLLKLAGYEVIGATLRTWVSEGGEDSRCCEIDDARRVAMKLGIRYFAPNCLAEFRSYVTEPFVRDYLDGLTPNPCIECNRYVKWERMLYNAKVLKANYVATGHYASVVRKENGRYTVKKAAHAEKDQTYMLYKLTQEQLAATLMPLGNLSKDEVRRIAEEAGLTVADKPDSQEICFVPEGTYADYICANAEGSVPGEGCFVDEDGQFLGRHKGIIHYTVGQRKGLGLALGRPVFVKEIRADRNEVVIADEEALFRTAITCRDVNYMSVAEMKPGERLRGTVKVRYHHAGQAAEIEALGDGRVQITFDEAVRAPAPGQSAVFYDEVDCVIGGGIIEKA